MATWTMSTFSIVRELTTYSLRELLTDSSWKRWLSFSRSWMSSPYISETWAGVEVAREAEALTRLSSQSIRLSDQAMSISWWSSSN